MAERVDVAIVGGGPGGTAAALSLRAHAPSLSTCVIEASGYDAPRLGETLPPIGQRLLAHLGVWEAFQREPHQASYGTVAAWGSATPHEQAFIASRYGRGWRLDRRAFDASLAAQAAARGVDVLQGARMVRLDRDPEGWRLALATPDGPRTRHARFVVDATGGAARVARAAHHRDPSGPATWEPDSGRSAPTDAGREAATGADRLIAFTRVVDSDDRRSQTVVEAFEHGWWYTATLPTGGRMVACFTDPDLARQLRLDEPASFECLLATMPIVGPMTRGSRAAGPIVARGVASRRLVRAAGDDWLAVGDAASVFDPLSSQGVLKALRSGVFASYAIADTLLRGEPSGLDRYRRYVRAEFDAYLETRAAYYAQEQRWPASPFWRRRHGRAPAVRHLR